MKRLFAMLMLSAFCTMLLLPHDTSAQGLLGKRYARVRISQTTPGNDTLKEIDDSIIKFGGVLNLPLSPRIDLDLSIQHITTDGILNGIDIDATALAVDAGVNIHLTPDDLVNPYLTASVGLVMSELEISSQGTRITEDDEDLTLSFGTGVEIDLSDRAALRSAVEYWRIGDENDVVARLSLSFWFAESIFAGLDTSYMFDDGNVTFASSLGVGF